MDSINNNEVQQQVKNLINTIEQIRILQSREKNIRHYLSLIARKNQIRLEYQRQLDSSTGHKSG